MTDERCPDVLEDRGLCLHQLMKAVHVVFVLEPLPVIVEAPVLLSPPHGLYEFAALDRNVLEDLISVPTLMKRVEHVIEARVSR